jgi:3-oxoacyl-[acyl-carrier-protein] synthase-3
VRASIRAISTHFPEATLTNDELAGLFSEWTPEKIEQKTGIRVRGIAREDETASDLAYHAAVKLFDGGLCRREEVDFVILVTQTPDYFLPASSCVLQHRLGLSTSVGAIDLNQGCSGWVYGLTLAKALVENGQSRCVLLLTADTYSKIMHDDDKATRPIFGDGAAATVIEAASPGTGNLIGDFVLGSDGTGTDHIVMRSGGFRCRKPAGGHLGADDFGSLRSEDHIYMNGPEVFNFTLRAVPAVFNAVLERHQLTLAELDLVVFHQANHYMLEHLRIKLRIERERFLIALRDHGNITSSTIPNALLIAEREGRIRRGARILAMGFGVGYSWGGTVLTWDAGLSAPKS